MTKDLKTSAKILHGKLLVHAKMVFMEILDFDVKQIFKVIEKKAKYQKVMLIYDENTSNLEIANIYDSIKEICIYNQQDLSKVDVHELNNGYRAIIYACSEKNFLKLNFNKNEFVNICIVKGKDWLPFCVNYDSTILEKDLYIFTYNDCFDINLYSSLCFNKFYNYLCNVVNLKENKFQVDCWDKGVNNVSIIESFQHLEKDFVFADLDIISKSNLRCEHLYLLHLILIDGFLLLLNNIKNKTLLLVDVYKVCKEDYVMLDKFYAMANNEMFVTMINLNYNYLINLCLKFKEEILSSSKVCDWCENDIEKILFELKDYAKNSNNLISYLYLYDFFKV